MNAILKTQVFADAVTEVANNIVDKLKDDTKDIDMNVGTDAVIGETLVKGIDAAGDAAIKVGEGINKASDGFSMLYLLQRWYGVLLLSRLFLLWRLCFISLMGNEALTGAIANKVLKI